MRQEATWTAADVTTAVEAFMETKGVLERTWDIDYVLIRRSIGAPEQLPNHLHVMISDQIMRSLNKLAAEGTLIKYKKDEHLPWAKPGVRLSNPMFFTLAAHEQAKSEGEEAEQQRVGYIQWRAALMATLKADYDIDSRLEFHGANDPDKASVIIPVDGWVKLLKLAELGKGVQGMREDPAIQAFMHKGLL